MLFARVLLVSVSVCCVSYCFFIAYIVIVILINIEYCVCVCILTLYSIPDSRRAKVKILKVNVLTDFGR